MRTTTPDDFCIKELQNAILNIAQYIDDFCTKNNIEYCLMSGSAIGALRHQGFIPWDDDLDIFMTPDNYGKFRTNFEKKGNHNDYYLQEWGGKKGKVSISKLRLNKSMYIEEDIKNWDVHQGIYVDIWILHRCPSNICHRINQFIWAKYLVAKGAANRHYSRKTGVVGLAIKLLELLPKRFLVDFALQQVYKYDDSPSEYVCHYLGRPTYSTGVYKSIYFEQTRRVAFETIQLNIPSMAEQYLTERWGDYMTLPPKEDIRKYQHCIAWSTTECFPSFHISGYYKDESMLVG